MTEQSGPHMDDETMNRLEAYRKKLIGDKTPDDSEQAEESKDAKSTTNRPRRMDGGVRGNSILLRDKEGSLEAISIPDVSKALEDLNHIAPSTLREFVKELRDLARSARLYDTHNDLSPVHKYSKKYEESFILAEQYFDSAIYPLDEEMSVETREDRRSERRAFGLSAATVMASNGDKVFGRLSKLEEQASHTSTLEPQNPLDVEEPEPQHTNSGESQPIQPEVITRSPDAEPDKPEPQVVEPNAPEAVGRVAVSSPESSNIGIEALQQTIDELQNRVKELEDRLQDIEDAREDGTASRSKRLRILRKRARNAFQAKRTDKRTEQDIDAIELAPIQVSDEFKQNWRAVQAKKAELSPTSFIEQVAMTPEGIPEDTARLLEKKRRTIGSMTLRFMDAQDGKLGALWTSAKRKYEAKKQTTLRERERGVAILDASDT